MLNGQPHVTVWAAGLLAFRQKPLGGSEYTHTVALMRGNDDQDQAAAAALAEAHRRYPDADGWRMHEVSVTSMSTPPPSIEQAGRVFAEVWAERQRHARLGHDAAADNELSLYVWVDKILFRTNRVVQALSDQLVLPGRPELSVGDREQAYRRRLIETASLCIAAVEAFDRGAALT
jgi:hypothetical protein